jgi:hypothetical protein
MLTTEQAYRAAYRFLEQYQARSQDAETAQALRWMSIGADGVTTDPAFWPDWLDAVDAALAEHPGPGAPLGPTPAD